ncbi:MAG: hypothetical protein NC336_10145 [Clostridium sp.]|nr:hypothetical protein [Clostridium sp.]
MQQEITEIFETYIRQYRNIDIADAEFKKNIHEDPALRSAYREWCDEVGSTEKNGFLDFCEEYLESDDEVWKTLDDYDE